RSRDEGRVGIGDGLGSLIDLEIADPPDGVAFIVRDQRLGNDRGVIGGRGRSSRTERLGQHGDDTGPGQAERDGHGNAPVWLDADALHGARSFHRYSRSGGTCVEGGYGGWAWVVKEVQRQTPPPDIPAAVLHFS